MIRQTIHNVSRFEIGEPKLLTGYESTFTRELLIENEDGERIEIILFTELNKETLLPKRMED